MQECWSDDPSQRPTAEQAHRRLLAMDPSSRPVRGPLTLWDPSRAAAPASLLHCILAAMQAQPGQPNAHLARVITANVADAARTVSGSAQVQLLMRQHGLTEMEAQTVSVYTTDARDHGGLREHSVFFVYNAATRSANPADVELWSAFSFLLCTALQKLPSVALTVFRGLDVPLTQLSHHYAVNGTVWYTSVTSTSTDKAKTLLQFGTGASGRPGTLLQINAVGAKDISDFSRFKAENEYIIPPNSCHKVQVALASAQVGCSQLVAQFRCARRSHVMLAGSRPQGIRHVAKRRRFNRLGSAKSRSCSFRPWDSSWPSQPSSSPWDSSWQSQPSSRPSSLHVPVRV